MLSTYEVERRIRVAGLPIPEEVAWHQLVALLKAAKCLTECRCGAGGKR